MFKKLLVISALACLSLAAKQYTITLAQPAQVGKVKLAPGDYKLKIDGSTATFTDAHNKIFTAPVKVEKVEKKAEYTAVETKQGGEINIIDLSGADFKLVF